jgi:hypothetical protein
LEGKQISFHRFVVDECLPTMQGSFERVHTQRILTFPVITSGDPLSSFLWRVNKSRSIALSWTNVSLLYRVPLNFSQRILTTFSGYFRDFTFVFPLEGKQISFHRFVMDDCLPTIPGSFERDTSLSVPTFSGYFRGFTFDFPLEGKQISFHRFVMDDCLPTIPGSFERETSLSVPTFSGSFSGCTFDFPLDGKMS